MTTEVLEVQWTVCVCALVYAAEPFLLNRQKPRCVLCVQYSTTTTAADDPKRLENSRHPSSVECQKK
jgi:hypothetical protein